MTTFVTVGADRWYQTAKDWKLDAAFYQWWMAFQQAQRLAAFLHQPCDAVRLAGGPGLPLYTVSTADRPGSHLNTEESK